MKSCTLALPDAAATEHAGAMLARALTVAAVLVSVWAAAAEAAEAAAGETGDAAALPERS